jgi:hypothetical protein
VPEELLVELEVELADMVVELFATPPPAPCPPPPGPGITFAGALKISQAPAATTAERRSETRRKRSIPGAFQALAAKARGTGLPFPAGCVKIHNGPPRLA